MVSQMRRMVGLLVKEWLESNRMKIQCLKYNKTIEGKTEEGDER